MNEKKDIYFHILDRELQETLETPLSESLIMRVLFVGLLITQNYYISYSHFCESSELYPNVNRVISFLQEQGAIQFLLADKNIYDFIEKRKLRYFYDKNRYPFYFNNYRKLYPCSPCIPRISSSTEYIRKGLNLLVNQDLRLKDFPAFNNQCLLEALDKHIPTNIDQALTIRAFVPAFSDKKIFKRKNDSILAKKQLEYTLSSLHSQSIIEETKATVFTDISGCEKYDFLALNSFYSFPIYEILLTPFLNFNTNDSIEFRNQLYSIVLFRDTPYFSTFCNDINSFISQVYQYELHSNSIDLNYKVWLNRFASDIKHIVYIANNGIEHSNIQVDTARRYLLRLQQVFQKYYLEGNNKVNHS